MATRFVFSKASPAVGSTAEISALANVYRVILNRLPKLITGNDPASQVPVAIETVRPMLARAFEAYLDAINRGGRRQEGPIERVVRATVRFDMTDPRAVAYAQTMTGNLIVEIEDSVKQQVRDLVESALAEGLTPEQVAAELRRTIGLHTRYANAVTRLERTVYENLRQQMTETAARRRAAEQAERYRNRLIRSRANAIARTEINRAQNYGRYLSWLQAVEEDLIDPMTTGKRWLATAPCDICKRLNGKTVGMTELFDGKYQMPPIHPHCKCTAVLVPNWRPGPTVIETPPVEVLKARERKYATRSEAARAAAAARWGNRTKIDEPAEPEAPAAAADAAEAQRRAEQRRWTPQRTVLEVENLLRSRYGLTTVDLMALPIEQANEVGATFNELATEYPEVAATIRILRAVDAYSYFGTASEAFQRIVISSAFSDMQHDKLAAESVVDGWHPAGTFSSDRTVNGRPINGTRQTMTHEFGHHVDYWLKNTARAEGRPDHEALKKKLRREVKKQFLAENKESMPKATVNDAIRLGLGQYANANTRELFAEAFSEYFLSDNPRPAATLIVERSFENIGRAPSGFRASTETMEKARERKYANRSEAARAAAQARWGNRGNTATAGYEQGAVTERRPAPVEVPVVRGEYGYADELDSERKVLDEVLTTAVDQFVSARVVDAAKQGPISLVGVHGTDRLSADLPFTGEASGTGMLEQGIYASPIDLRGVRDQQRVYQKRGRQALLRMDMKKAIVYTTEIDQQVNQKYGFMSYDSGAQACVAAALMERGLSTKDFHEQFARITGNSYNKIDARGRRGYSKTFEDNSSVEWLASQGYDGLIYQANGWSIMSVFKPEQIKVIDPTLSVEERKLVYYKGTFGVNAERMMEKAVMRSFDGRAFEYVPWDLVEQSDLAKAKKRKYGNRSIAGRVAALARWRGRGYRQNAKTEPLPDGRRVRIGDVKTVEVPPFNAEEFVKAAAEGPVTITGIHASRDVLTGEWSEDPSRLGKGWLGPGTYASIIDPTGMEAQRDVYSIRPYQLMLEVTLKKPLVLTEQTIRAEVEHVGVGIASAAADLTEIHGMDRDVAFGFFSADRALAIPVLKEAGYDGIVYLKTDPEMGFEHGSQVSAFNARESVKIVDAFISPNEQDILEESARQSVMLKVDAPRFDGSNMDLVPIDGLGYRVEKARERKYANRSEAARAAAAARWGNRGKTETPEEKERREAEEWNRERREKVLAEKAEDRKWETCETVAEVNARLKEMYPHILVGIKNVSVEIANEIGATFHELASDYPVVASAVRYLMTNSNTSVLGSVDPLNMSLAYSHAYSLAQTEQMAKLAQQTEWSPKGTYDPSRIVNGHSVNSVRETVTHEFGHLIEAVFDRRATMADTEAARKKAKKAARAAVEEQLGPQKLSDGRTMPVKQVIERHLSRYGATNKYETFAESFAEYTLSANPRPFAETYVKTMFAAFPKLVEEPYFRASVDGVSKARERKYANRSEAARAAARARWGNRTNTDVKPSKKVVAWRTLKTTEEITAAWNDKWGSICRGDFTYMNPKFAGEVAKGLDAMFEKYPDVAKKSVNWVGSVESEEHGEFALERGFNGAERGFPPGVWAATGTEVPLILFSTESHSTIASAVQTGRDSGWSVPFHTDVSAGEYVAIHEFGHAVNNYITETGRLARDWESGYPWMAVEYVADAGRKRAETTLPAHPHQTTSDRTRDIGNALSRYGAVDVNEMFAESWAERETSNNPRSYALAMLEGAFEYAGVSVDSPVQKATFSNRSDAARYAARARWGTRTSAMEVPLALSGAQKAWETRRRNAAEKARLEGLSPAQRAWETRRRNAAAKEQPAPKMTRGGWKAQKSTAGVTKAWNELWGDTVKGDFRGLDVTVANTFAATMDELLVRFPMIADKLHSVSSTQGFKYVNYAHNLVQPLRNASGDSWSGFEYGKWSFIRISTSYGKKATPNSSMDAEKWEQYSKYGASAEGGYYHVRDSLVGTGHQAARMVVVHEFGHQFGYAINGGYRLGQAGTAVVADILGMPRRSSFAEMRPQIQKQLSLYGGTNMDELVAESFVEVMLSPNPRPFAVNVIKGLAAAGTNQEIRENIDSLTTRLSSSLNVEMGTVAKAMNRSEAGRYAARARWGSRGAQYLDDLMNGQTVTLNGGELPGLLLAAVDANADADLSKVKIRGYQIFDDANFGLRRSEMPQVPARYKPQFLSGLRKQGVQISTDAVDPRSLSPTQAEISAAGSGRLLRKMLDGRFTDTPAGRIIVSSDGFVLDGHHRWAAFVARSFADPKTSLQVTRIGMAMKDLLPVAQRFTDEMGIPRLSIDDTR